MIFVDQSEGGTYLGGNKWWNLVFLKILTRSGINAIRNWPNFCNYCLKRWYVCTIAGKNLNEEITAHFLLSTVTVKSYNTREAGYVY